MTLLYLSLAFTTGIAAGSVLAGYFLRSEVLAGCSLPPWCFPAVAALLLGSLLLARRRPRAALAVGLALFFVLGAWRYTASPFERCWSERDLAFYQSENGVWATLEGQVTGFPEVRDRATHYRLAVERVVVDGQEHEVRGLALVEAPRYPVYAYGDTLRASGLLLAPPISDDFDYRRYLAVRNMHSLVRRPRIQRLASGGGQGFWRALYRARSRGAAVIDRIMPEPAAGLANGMVLGIEGGISDEVADVFRATGTSHLIVISGSNIAFLAGALVAVLGRGLSRRRAALAAAPFVLLYVLLVGADPPALRAGVMGLLALGAIFFGRRGTAYVSLCAAALVMLAINPLTLWDAGFQLSFMTSLGLILFARPLSAALLAALEARMPADAARRWTGALEGTIVVTLAAQAAALPVILAHFGSLSPVSLLANALVLPVQPAILAGGIAALLAGAVWPLLGQIVGTAPWLLLTYTVAVVRAGAALPFATVDTGRVGLAFVTGYYILLVLVFVAPRLFRGLRRRPQLRRASGWAALMVAPLCFAFFAWRLQPDGRLHVIFLAGETTESVLLVGPAGQTAWVWDGRGGAEPPVEAARSGGWLRGRPDVVLADCDASPWPGTPCVDPAELAPGSALELAGGVRLTRLAPEGSRALLLTYGQLCLVLPPGAQESGPDQVTVVKAPGPGTGVWPSVAHLRAARPQLVLWPLETTYPPDVAHYLATQVVTTRVDPRAAVEVVSDGRSFWLARHSATGPR